MAERTTENNDTAGEVDPSVFEEQLKLHGADNPSMILVSSLLDEKNYLVWRNSMITALEAKTKIGFIDGSCVEPTNNTSDQRRWRKANSMVVAWIKNSISKEIVNDFMYVQGAKELWDEIEEKYGAANSALLFQIKRDIALMHQDDMTISQYYSRLKQLWDQLDQLRPPLVCIGTIKKQIEERELEDKAMQFLMGLNDVYEGIRDQILMMENLPSVNRIFSMVLRAETQRRIKTNMTTSIDNSALAARVVPKPEGVRNFSTARRGYPRRDKSNLKCSHCNRNGHSKDECFLLHGYPEWYHEFKARKQSASVNAANIIADTPFDGQELESMISNLIQREFKKSAKEQGFGDEGKMPVVNFAHYEEFAGPSE